MRKAGFDLTTSRHAILLFLSLFLILAFFDISIAVSAASTDQATATGAKCIPFPSFDGQFVNGFSSSACSKVLRNAGYTHFLATDVPIAPIPQIPQAMCDAEAFYIHEAPSARLANVFTGTQPSTLCQNILLLSSCLHDIPVCDPKLDTSAATLSKPCQWTCEVVKESYAEFCTTDDISYLQSVGFDLGDLAGSGGQYFNCDSERYAPAGAENTLLPDGRPGCIGVNYIGTDPIGARCEQYSGTTCLGVFPSGTSIHVPVGVSQSEIEIALSSSSALLNALPIEADSQCVVDTLRAYCQSLFRECLTEFGVKQFPIDPMTGQAVAGAKGTTTSLPLALTPPKESCESYVGSCTDTSFFQSVMKLLGNTVLADCDKMSTYRTSLCLWPTMPPPASNQIDVNIAANLDNTTTAANFAPTAVTNEQIFDTLTSNAFNQRNFLAPYENSVWNVRGPNPSYIYTGTTFPAKAINTIRDIPYDGCNPPLVLASEKDSAVTTIFGTATQKARCTFPCPSPALSSKEINAIEDSTWAIVIIALVLTIFLAATFLVFHSQRHKNLLLWYILSFLGAVFIIFVGLINRKDGSMWKAQCTSPTRYEHMKGFAFAQPFLLIYFLSVSTSFWLMQAVDLFQKLILGHVYRRGSKAAAERNIAMHIFCWIPPLFIVAAIACAGQFGYDTWMPVAWVTPDPAMSSTPIALSWMFFIHLILCSAIGFTLTGIVVVFIFKYKNQTQGLKKVDEHMNGDKITTKMKIAYIFKLFGFVLLIVPLLVILLTKHVYTTSNYNHWEEALAEWGRELALSKGGINLVTGQPTPALKDHMPTSLIIATMFGLCSPAYIMFIVFYLLQKDVPGLWMGLFYYRFGVQCCKRWAKEDTATGSDGTGSGSGGSTGSSGGSNQSAQSGGGLFGAAFLRSKAHDRSTENKSTSGDSAGARAVSQQRPVSAVNSDGDRPSNVTLFTSPADGTSRSTGASTPVRRTLFKGMTKGSQDHRPKSRMDLETINDGPEDHEGRRTQTGIELGRMESVQVPPDSKNDLLGLQLDTSSHAVSPVAGYSSATFIDTGSLNYGNSPAYSPPFNPDVTDATLLVARDSDDE